MFSAANQKETSGAGKETPERNPYSSDGVSGASRRLRALAALSGSLTDALTPKEAADLVEQKALSALDATSAIVVTLGAFPPVPKPGKAPPLNTPPRRCSTSST